MPLMRKLRKIAIATISTITSSGQIVIFVGLAFLAYFYLNRS